MPRSGQNSLRRLVRRTSRPATSMATLSVSVGSVTTDLATRLLQRLEPGRTLSVADGAGNGHVFEFEARLDAPQHQTAAAHVAASHEVNREHQALAENRQQQIDVLPRGHA